MFVFTSINKISDEVHWCLVLSLLFSSFIPDPTPKSMFKMFMRSNANFLCPNFILKTNRNQSENHNKISYWWLGCLLLLCWVHQLNNWCDCSKSKLWLIAQRFIALRNIPAVPKSAVIWMLAIMTLMPKNSIDLMNRLGTVLTAAIYYW